MKLLVAAAVIVVLFYFLGTCAVKTEEMKVPAHDAPQLAIVGEQSGDEEEAEKEE